MNKLPHEPPFIDIEGKRFQCINHVEQMSPFFFGAVSPEDHWMFAASNGSLSAGRGSPDTALFPYYTVDKIVDNWNTTGPQTIIIADGKRWEPFKPYTRLHYTVNQRLLKSIEGDEVIFDETNEDLQLKFIYRWRSSYRYGFVRQVELINLGPDCREMTVVDGLCNIMPAGLDSRTHLNYSCLADAYKISELDAKRQLLIHRMASSLTDEAVPMECLLATTIWSFGWPESVILLKHEDAECYLSVKGFKPVNPVRASRGCFLNAGHIELDAMESKCWSQVAELNQSQRQVAELQSRLGQPALLWAEVLADVDCGYRRLQALVASADGQQVSEEEVVTAHHRANVLFNIMRGGVFSNSYKVSRSLLIDYIGTHRNELSDDQREWLNALPESIDFPHLIARAHAEAGLPVSRLCGEYLPLTFSRRHGDPSRPWNQFTIRTRNDKGDATVGFQGNWRDIFQNWEALSWSFPHFNNAFLHQFLNASTADGYNPYRITSEGIEWEKPDPDDPWASIGYWGDHQIIYLLKFLEFSFDMSPSSLQEQLGQSRFVFADVPYEIKSFESLESDPNHSIYFNVERDKLISERVKLEGADGKLLHDEADNLINANLLEKLLIPLAVKLSNFVPGGGIWMNTQRPEWNDANNALAGYGLSVVTTCYLHRYVNFLENLLGTLEGDFECHEGLCSFLGDLGAIFQSTACSSKDLTPGSLYATILALGKAGEAYRSRIYRGDIGRLTPLNLAEVKTLLGRAQSHLVDCIRHNMREDGLYHSYNILLIRPEQKTAMVKRLDLMLEGQVAALGSGAVSPQGAVILLEALAASSLYCPRRKSYMLYPDKVSPGFLAINRVEVSRAIDIPLLRAMREVGNNQLLIDSPTEHCMRFHPQLANRFDLTDCLDRLAQEEGREDLVEGSRQAILELYEETFNHRAFTGRSGSMFAYEGLGSIYWHMVSKLMLSVAELAIGVERMDDTDVFAALRRHYYAIQNGLGFRKTPQEYGSFPADAYSHTPSSGGAQQPGLTGMVKEGILCRFAEMGVRYLNGEIVFRPRLLREEEFLINSVQTEFIHPAGDRENITVPARSLLFSLAQVPVLYTLHDNGSVYLTISFDDGSTREISSDTLPVDVAAELASRTGRIKRIEVCLPAAALGAL
jgi:hypothetical protein